MYKFKDFLPLILLFSLISAGSWYLSEGNLMFFMQMFMGLFFLCFGFLKVIKLKAFAKAYSMYDVISSRIYVYGFIYPFIELTFAWLYLTGTYLSYTNIAVLVVMSISALGVYLKLRKGEEIMCACLGTVFKLPMTWVTLVEDVLMAAMAVMLLSI
ncbi:hypothetical protein COB52_01370 [Candidatus Kaiserbacteria bacterium]|nr:MAG: hypothetical protein COB52_01370 [Candidatus Kaiserbacteria bacterium]